MNLQFLSDSNGETTGVFIPINEWNQIKDKISNLDLEGNDIPDWHKHILDKRMEGYGHKLENATDFDIAIDNIEKEF